MKKNLRKILAVVLVVAMALSLMAVASAADITGYSDASSITQKEAVNVLTTAGVLSGDNGAFNPTGTFTREQAAKVICYLVLGTSVANTLATSTSSFADVAASRWSAPYIQYCAAKGIINGDGMGNFNPEASVTGIQFAKLILTALGYGKMGEYVGPNWAIDAVSDGTSLGILTGSVDFSKPATREQVALYALNSLELIFQTYSATNMAYTPSAALVNTFAGKLLLTRTPTTAAGTEVIVNGQTGHTWSYNGMAYFAFYPDESIIATNTDGTAISSLVNTTLTTFKATLAAGFTEYVNGTAATVLPVTGATVTAGTYYYSATTTTGDLQLCTHTGTVGGTAVLANAIVAGVTVQFIDNTPGDGYNYANKIAVTIQKVDTVAFNAVMTTKGINGNPDNVSVALAGGTISGTTQTMTGYTGLNYLDVVTYYMDNLGVTHFTKCTPTAGMLQGFDSVGANVTIAGKNYTLSAETGASALSAYQAISYYNSMTVYTDANGYAVYVTGATVAPTSNMAVVLAYGTVGASGVAGSYEQVQILMPDGTTKIVNAVNPDTVDIAPVVGPPAVAGIPAMKTVTSNMAAPIVTYSINATNGYYTFAAATNVKATGATITSGYAGFTTGLTANSVTVFLVQSGTAATGYTYAEYTGFAKVPSMTGATYYENATSGICNLVYVSAATTVSASSNTIFFYSTYNTYTAPSTSGAGDDYNTYTAVVGTTGAQTVKVEAAINSSITTAGAYSVTYDSNGKVNSAVLISAPSTYLAEGTATVTAANSVVGIGGTYYAYASTAPVYVYNASAGAAAALSTMTVPGISTGSVTNVVAVLDTNYNVIAVYILN